MFKQGFDPELYMQLQAKYIRERVGRFGNKLYLEFGGKLFDDYHASRVLPGFDANAKAKLLMELKDEAEIIFVISAPAIAKNKIRADIGITYDRDLLRLVDALTDMGLYVSSVVITQYTDQDSALQFKKQLEARGLRTYLHRPTKGFPTDINTILSDEGFGANPYIETSRPLVVVTAPGPGSGKLGTCLSQIYHEQKRGVKAGYAKFETFPIWNLPLKHPVNLAYEAATADLHDANMIDPYHFEKYGAIAINYNRDIEAFPVLKTVLNRVLGEDIYYSPTDMGVNMVGNAISDDEVVREAACQEIIRRWFQAVCDARLGRSDDDIPERIALIMQQLDLKETMRPVVQRARAKAEQRGVPAIAFRLPDERLTTGRDSYIMTAAASGVINAIKALAGLDDGILLLPQTMLDPAIKMKREMLHTHDSSLSLSDVLLILSVCSINSEMASRALEQLPKLNGCDAHCTVMLGSADADMLRRLGVRFTSDPNGQRCSSLQ